jgi:hypothetical protein
MLSLTRVNIFIVSACLLVLLFLAVWFLVIKSAFNGSLINTDRTAVIKEMRDLQRLETASFTIEKIIDGGTTGNNIFQQFLFGDKILLIAHGQVIAGFDFSQISDKDLEIDGNKIRVVLPEPQILVTTLDNTQTRVYDRQKGILNPGEKDLESEARKAAEESIKKAACEGGILNQASDNGRKQLTALLNALGFIEVSIDIPEAECK